MADVRSPWLEAFNSVIAYDKNEIKQWYELSEDRTKNPGQFIDLNEHAKTYFGLINESLLNSESGSVDVKLILVKLKEFYKNVDEVSQRDELVLFDLMIETYKQTDIFQPEFDFKVSFPKFEAHFNKNMLEILNLKEFFKKTEDYSPVDFLCRFRQVITKDVIEKLDKASEIENKDDSTNASFSYQSELEFCYIDIIINMTITSYNDDALCKITAKAIDTWLNKYPFRLMNSRGVYTPDNFFISFNNYVNSLASDYDKKRIAFYYGFFNKLKLTRSPVQANIETHSDFLDKYDSSTKYEQNGIGSSDKSIRSIYFREDFDYLNSLNLKGINLNRAFWTVLDTYVSQKNLKLSKYIILISTAKGVDEFYNTIYNDLGINNNDFLQKMKERIERYKKICDSENVDFNFEILPTADEVVNRAKVASLKNAKNAEDLEKTKEVEKINEFDKDLEFIDDSDHKMFAMKGIHFIYRRIKLKKDADENTYIHYQKSEKTRIIKDPSNSSDTPLKYCLGAERCELISYYSVLVHNDTNTNSFNFPIHKNTYADTEDTDGKMRNALLHSAAKKEIRLHMINFRMDKIRDNMDKITIDMNYDITNADNTSIEDFVKIFTENQYFSSISIDYTILPEKATLAKPTLRASKFKERKEELIKRINKLNNETMVDHENKLDKLRIEGIKAENHYRQIILDIELEEIGANAARRDEIEKIKKTNESELAKVIEANKLRTEEAQAKLEETREESKRIAAEIQRRESEREKARRVLHDTMEAENKKREEERAANEEIKRIKSTHTPIDADINKLRKRIEITSTGWGQGKYHTYVLAKEKCIKLIKDVNTYNAGPINADDINFEEEFATRLAASIELYSALEAKRSEVKVEEAKTSVNTKEVASKLIGLTTILLEVQANCSGLLAFIDESAQKVLEKTEKATRLLSNPTTKAKIKAAEAEAAAAKAAAETERIEAAAKELAAIREARVAAAKKPAGAPEAATKVAKPDAPKVLKAEDEFNIDWIIHKKTRGKIPQGFLEYEGYWYKENDVIKKKTSGQLPIGWTEKGEFYFKNFPYISERAKRPLTYDCKREEGCIKQ